MEQMQKMQRKYWVKISFLSRREREDVRTKYNSTHYYKLALTGLKPSKLAANRFYFSLVSRDTILNQRLISRELLPRLPSCQPRRQPALPWWNCSLAYRGVATIYYLGIVSIDIYSIYRYLQQHCVMAETHHSQLSAAREVGKNYQTLVNKFFSLRISNQDCVLCFVFFNTDITKLWCAITCFPQCDICGVCYIGSTGCWSGQGCTCLKFPEPPGVSRP